MKISIDTVSNTNLSFNAGVKPRKDVNKTLYDCGFDIRIIALKKSKMPFFNRFVLFKDFIKAIANIKYDDEVVIQYPLFFYSNFLEYISLKKLCRKCNNVTLLIHDINYIRSGNNQRFDAKLLNLPNRLFVHNEKMGNVVREELLNHDVKMNYLILFDYYSQVKMLSPDRIKSMKSFIAFAGNLKKSQFLNKLNNLSSNIDWNLYGVISDSNLSFNDNIHYIGKFNPDNPNILEAGWGLVWDGNDIDSCSGERGNYLRFNSPHKCSLYLSRGIPIIVWKESALSDFVEKENIGFAINSLQELPAKIHDFSESDYDIIVHNARSIGEKLKQGFFLKRLINT